MIDISIHHEVTSGFAIRFNWAVYLTSNALTNMYSYWRHSSSNSQFQSFGFVTLFTFNWLFHWLLFSLCPWTSELFNVVANITFIRLFLRFIYCVCKYNNKQCLELLRHILKRYVVSFCTIFTLKLASITCMLWTVICKSV